MTDLIQTFEDEPCGEPSSRATTRQCLLFLALEADRPWAGGCRYCLTGTSTVVFGRGSERRAVFGKDAGDTLSIAIPSRSLSGTHARLVRSGAQWSVEDAGSRNGTYLNGRRVETASIVEGDMLEMGRTFWSLRRACTPVASAPHLDSADLAEIDGLSTLLPEAAARNDALRRVATSMVPVLVLGESGTGKELVARCVHSLSGRSGQFVAINCGAIPHTLVEATLFGHAKGAFTGANSESPGIIRAADRGTLLLDEIADLPLPSQAALLRVLEESEVTAVGAVRPTKVDVRVIAATHQPIRELERAGRFRTDLLARIAGFVHHVPPLRERREDLGHLVAALLRRLHQDAAQGVVIAPAVARAMLTYAWPWNVRELKQWLAVNLAVSRDGVLGPEFVPLGQVVKTDPPPGFPVPPVSPPADESKPRGFARRPEASSQIRTMLTALLREHNGNVAEVGRVMKKRPTQIRRWAACFGLDLASFRRPRVDQKP